MEKRVLLTEEEYSEYQKMSEHIKELEGKKVVLVNVIDSYHGLFNKQILYGEAADKYLKDFIEGQKKKIERLEAVVKEYEGRSLIERIMNKKIEIQE